MQQARLRGNCRSGVACRCLLCGRVGMAGMVFQIQQAFPTLAWKASFIQPDTTTLQQESKALQLLTNGPYNALPNNLLYNLRQIGLPAQAHSLRTTSLAARTRNALYTMRNYHNNINLLHDHYTHDDTMLHPPQQHWIDNSILLSLHDAVQTTQPLMQQI